MHCIRPTVAWFGLVSNHSVNSLIKLVFDMTLKYLWCRTILPQASDPDTFQGQTNSHSDKLSFSFVCYYSYLFYFLVTDDKEPWWYWAIRDPTTMGVSLVFKNLNPASPCQTPISAGVSNQAGMVMVTITLGLALIIGS